MRLKHLILQGYKSFATKTEFLFPTGITAIVGPNGSGKSNIADAIRWVLGEQSMHALRGKSTADMIFAGGRRRPRAGMAEVSLTLDNADGWLPIEFSEVTITRRAYRSGENEYLINGARVRLRDVTELLAESGLGQRTYTVIGQGLVDAALALRPQERRTLFEEAAGISLYRARREEALKRLEETQRNLERVYDIIGEISPRLRRLEQEVERLEEYRRLTAHLERLQRTWYGYQWGRQQDLLTHALDVAAALKANLETLQREATELNQRLGQLRQRESDLRARLRDWHRESAAIYDQANAMQRELAVAEERARLLDSQCQEMLAELEPLESQQAAQAERVAQVQAQIVHLEHDLAEHQERLAALEQEWDALNTQAQVGAERRIEAEQAIRACRARLEQLGRALDETRAEVARLDGEWEALEKMRAAGAAYDAGVRALLQANLPGVIGPLAALIRVPPEWERAIEAALGPDLQAIVVEQAAVAAEVQRLLESTAGRVTLLPLDSLRPVPSLPAGVLCATSLVTCDERLRPAVEAMLGGIALCSDLTAAWTLLRAMPPGSRCVTADGIVLHTTGAISVGTATTGLLAGERAHRELPARIEEARRRCREIEHEQQVELAQVAALEAEVEELARQTAAAREKAAQFERETLAQARMEVAIATESLRSQRATLQREQALLERVQAQIVARRQRIQELEAEQGSMAARIQELRTQCMQMNAQVQQIQARIQPAEEELARLGEEQAALEAQEQRARDRARDAEARFGHAQLEVDRCGDALEFLSRRIEEDIGLVQLELAEAVTAQTPLPIRPIVSELPIVEELPDGLEEEIQRLKARLRRVSGVNPNAAAEYAEVKERHQFLTTQSADLEAASAQLRQVVTELDELMNRAFRETFEAVGERFTETFKILFSGGDARLDLTEPDDLMNTGVDIIAQPPGKRAQRLALLSGGERSLTAVALMFALLQVSPAPFCVLDEVDAMLDESNVGRFRTLLKEMAQKTQFIIITHNRFTVEAADTVYGVSMGADAASQVVSLKLE